MFTSSWCFSFRKLVEVMTLGQPQEEKHKNWKTWGSENGEPT